MSRAVSTQLVPRLRERGSEGCPAVLVSLEAASPQLYPGPVQSIREAWRNRHQRRALRGQIALARLGRETGARV